METFDKKIEKECHNIEYQQQLFDILIEEKCPEDAFIYLEEMENKVKKLTNFTEFLQRYEAEKETLLLKNNIQLILERINLLNSREKLLGKEPTKYDTLGVLEINHFYDFWRAIVDWETNQNKWLDSTIKEIDSQEVSSKLSEMIGNDTTQGFDSISLKSALELGANVCMEKINEISDQANYEFCIEKALGSIKKEWTEKTFEFNEQLEGKGYILVMTNDLKDTLQDHNVAISQLGRHVYAKHFSAELKEWEHQLASIQDTIELWEYCQAELKRLSLFVHLCEAKTQHETIFDSFEKLNEKWSSLMQQASQNPEVVILCCQIHIENSLYDLLRLLNSNRKVLYDQIYEKRYKFPRFYFLTNDELIRVWGSDLNPQSFDQMTLLKLYEGVNSLKTNGEHLIEAVGAIDGLSRQFIIK
ncbi:hypothetical protein IE077_002069 [Cardiosporidium cionae]|uniref:Dynein heavy chain linker domain-containing protein n=1 Tax=Cardiosporidium cionae TaxID=476202 RepID=A0ABQ7JBN6_9APIC|nr:hypothetical protein IE077_002069 [Cardiosporidium cionae]|eukprot:KAF8821412.1 hypothetical protein IE077_002069 [Cardiosporidium cionae]